MAHISRRTKTALSWQTSSILSLASGIRRGGELFGIHRCIVLWLWYTSWHLGFRHKILFLVLWPALGASRIDGAQPRCGCSCVYVVQSHKLSVKMFDRLETCFAIATVCQWCRALLESDSELGLRATVRNFCRAGLIPVDHAKHNRDAIRNASRTNRERRFRGEDPVAMPDVLRGRSPGSASTSPTAGRRGSSFGPPDGPNRCARRLASLARKCSARL